MKLSPGKYSPENCLGIFSMMKIPTLPHMKTPLAETPPLIIALQQMKKQTIFKIQNNENKRLVLQLFYKNLVEYIKMTFDNWIS